MGKIFGNFALPASPKSHASRAPQEFPVVIERGPTGLKGIAKIYLTPVVVKGQRYD